MQIANSVFRCYVWVRCFATRSLIRLLQIVNRMDIIFGIIITLGLVIWTLWGMQESSNKEKARNTKSNAPTSEEPEIDEPAVIDAYRVESPWEAVALLIVGILSLDSDIPPDLRREVELIFEADFGLTRLNAKAMYDNCTEKLQDVDNFIRELPVILEPSVLLFRYEQVKGLPAMLKSIASIDGEPSPRQLAAITKIEKIFLQSLKS